MVCGIAAPAVAQDVSSTIAQRTARRSLPVACADYAQLCPQPDTGPLGGRELLVCLKDHKLDVSLACRRVIAAAQNTPAAAR
jgi:hypothetical protein